MATFEISGRFWALVREDDGSRLAWVWGAPDSPYRVPESLYSEAWSALGTTVRATVDEEGFLVAVSSG